MDIPLTSLAFGLPNGMEWVVILVVALLIFGRRLPNVMRSIGGSMREFKKGINEGMPEEDDNDVSSEKKKDNTAPGAVSRESSEADDASHYNKSEDDGKDAERSL